MHRLHFYVQFIYSLKGLFCALAKATNFSLGLHINGKKSSRIENSAPLCLCADAKVACLSLKYLGFAKMGRRLPGANSPIL